MRQTYFKILIVLLVYPMLSYAQPVFDCDTPSEGNWLQVFYNKTYWPSGFPSSGYHVLGSENYYMFKYNDSSMVKNYFGVSFRPISIDNKDTINLLFKSIYGEITISLINQNVLIDTVPCRFILGNLPSIPGRYFVLLNKNIKEHDPRGYCGYNITPKNWYNHLVVSLCDKQTNNQERNNSLIISYGFDFNSPLKEGQFIALDSLNSENNKKPYVVIDHFYDSLKVKYERIKSLIDSEKSEIKIRQLRGSLLFPDGFKVYTDLGPINVSLCYWDGHYNIDKEFFESSEIQKNYILVLAVSNFDEANENEQNNRKYQITGPLIHLERVGELQYQLYRINGQCYERLRIEADSHAR